MVFKETIYSYSSQNSKYDNYYYNRLFRTLKCMVY